MRVRVDQPRYDVAARDVNDRRACRWRKWLVLDLSDLAVADDEGRVGRNCSARAVSNIRMTKHYHRCRLLCDAGRCGRNGRGQAENKMFHGSSRIE